MKLAELESLKETVKEREDMLSIAYAKIASLEEEGIRKTLKIDRSDVIFENMKERLEEANSKTNGGNPKTRKEVYEKNKEVKILNQKLEENIKSSGMKPF